MITLINKNLKFIVSLISTGWAAYAAANPHVPPLSVAVDAAVGSALVWLVPNLPPAAKTGTIAKTVTSSTNA